MGWRLLGANNRELGRSAYVYTDTADALLAVQALRATAALLTMNQERDAAGQWRWWAALDGTLVAVSGRGFRRAQDCLLNEEQFVAALRRRSDPRSRRNPIDGAGDVTLRNSNLRGA